MGLSSNSIIHFTNTLKNLNGILADNFKIRYCRETIETTGKRIDILVPVVSFCDIPFSQVITHIGNYGSYGIGLKKSWAEENGLNPVLYLDKHSSLANNIGTHLFTKLADFYGPSKSLHDLTIEEKNAMDVIRYLKNYQGDLSRHGKKSIKNYRFSDEREWRYVLGTNNDNLIYGNLSKAKDGAHVKDLKEKVNAEIIDKRLTFTPNDISYIIIKKESERDNVIRSLETVKGKYPHEEVRRLTSRILSVEQLKTDF